MRFEQAAPGVPAALSEGIRLQPLPLSLRAIGRS